MVSFPSCRSVMKCLTIFWSIHSSNNRINTSSKATILWNPILPPRKLKVPWVSVSGARNWCCCFESFCNHVILHALHSFRVANSHVDSVTLFRSMALSCQRSPYLINIQLRRRFVGYFIGIFLVIFEPFCNAVLFRKF